MARFFKEIRNHPEYNMNNSWTWFNQKVKALATYQGIGPQKLLGEYQDRQSTDIEPGKMYMYLYDAKYKNELPYFDKFPLVLPFSEDAQHFTGLNLHYLEPRLRLVLLDRLLDFVDDDKLGKNAKIEVSWQLLSKASMFPEVAPCVKKYLKGYVKSRFLEIHPKDFVSAIFLPLERFSGAGTGQVWRDSQRRIG